MLVKFTADYVQIVLESASRTSFIHILCIIIMYNNIVNDVQEQRAN